MSPRALVTEHGAGAMGVRGCYCELCKGTRARRRAELKDQRRKTTNNRRLADWEKYNGTPTRLELLEARG